MKEGVGKKQESVSDDEDDEDDSCAKQFNTNKITVCDSLEGLNININVKGKVATFNSQKAPVVDKYELLDPVCEFYVSPFQR